MHTACKIDAFVNYLQEVHANDGLPKKPGRHAHRPTCLLAVQMAFSPHTSNLHALVQLPRWQIWSSAHCSFLSHCGLTFTKTKGHALESINRPHGKGL